MRNIRGRASTLLDAANRGKGKESSARPTDQWPAGRLQTAGGVQTAAEKLIGAKAGSRNEAGRWQVDREATPVQSGSTDHRSQPAEPEPGESGGSLGATIKIIRFDKRNR